MNIKFQSSYTLTNRYNNLMQSQNNNQIIENTKIKDNSIGVILELGKNNNLEKSTLEKSTFENINRDELFNIKKNQNYLDNIEKQKEEIFNNVLTNFKEKFGINLSDDTIEYAKSLSLFISIPQDLENGFSEDEIKNIEITYTEILLRDYFMKSDAEEIIESSKNVINGLKNVYAKDSQEYKELSDTINRDMKFFAEKSLASKLISRFIKLKKMPELEQDKEKSNSIFDKYKIKLSYKDENIDYSKHIDDLNKDAEIVVNNMLAYFEKYNSFQGFNNDIASKGTKSFTYNQMTNVESYDEFSYLIDKLYSSETFEDAEEAYKELENLINDKEYSSSINKEKFKLVEEDFKKLKELIK